MPGGGTAGSLSDTIPSPFYAMPQRYQAITDPSSKPAAMFLLPSGTRKDDGMSLPAYRLSQLYASIYKVMLQAYERLLAGWEEEGSVMQNRTRCPNNVLCSGDLFFQLQHRPSPRHGRRFQRSHREISHQCCKKSGVQNWWAMSISSFSFWKR